MEAVSPSIKSASPASVQVASPSVRPARRRYMAPLEPVSPKAKWLLGTGFFVLFLLVWFLLSVWFTIKSVIGLLNLLNDKPI